MLDLEQIGYFLYMEQQEQDQEQLKVNVDQISNFIDEQARSEEEQDNTNRFS